MKFGSAILQHTSQIAGHLTSQFEIPLSHNIETITGPNSTTPEDAYSDSNVDPRFLAPVSVTSTPATETTSPISDQLKNNSRGSVKTGSVTTSSTSHLGFRASSLVGRAGKAALSSTIHVLDKAQSGVSSWFGAQPEVAKRDLATYYKSMPAQKRTRVFDLTLTILDGSFAKASTLASLDKAPVASAPVSTAKPPDKK